MVDHYWYWLAQVVLGNPPPLSVWPYIFHGAGHEKRRGEQLKWSLASVCAYLHILSTDFVLFQYANFLIMKTLPLFLLM